MGEITNAYKILVGKPIRKIPLGGSSRRWEDIELCIVGKYVLWVWIVFNWRGLGTGGGLLLTL
jgi:hypothetical protein